MTVLVTQKHSRRWERVQSATSELSKEFSRASERESTMARPGVMPRNKASLEVPLPAYEPRSNRDGNHLKSNQKHF